MRDFFLVSFLMAVSLLAAFDSWQIISNEVGTPTSGSTASYDGISSKRPAGIGTVSISLSQNNVTIVQGSTILVDVSVSLNPTSVLRIGLSARHVPAGTSISFNPSTGRSSFSSLMTIVTTDATPLGQSNVTVVASGSAFEKSTSLLLTVIPVIHDLAVISATVQASATIGSTVVISATVANYGSVSETFRIEATVNETMAAGKSLITLKPFAKYTVALSWNTTGFMSGVYEVVVAVQPVPGETDLTNNSLQAGQITLEQTSQSKPSPTPSATGSSASKVPYGTVLAVAVAIGEFAVVFFLFLKSSKRSLRKSGVR